MKEMHTQTSQSALEEMFSVDSLLRQIAINYTVLNHNPSPVILKNLDLANSQNLILTIPETAHRNSEYPGKDEVLAQEKIHTTINSNL